MTRLGAIASHALTTRLRFCRYFLMKPSRGSRELQVDPSVQHRLRVRTQAVRKHGLAPRNGSLQHKGSELGESTHPSGSVTGSITTGTTTRWRTSWPTEPWTPNRVRKAFSPRETSNSFNSPNTYPTMRINGYRSVYKDSKVPPAHACAPHDSFRLLGDRFLRRRSPSLSFVCQVGCW